MEKGIPLLGTLIFSFGLALAQDKPSEPLGTDTAAEKPAAVPKEASLDSASGALVPVADIGFTIKDSTASASDSIIQAVDSVSDPVSEAKVEAQTLDSAVKVPLVSEPASQPSKGSKKRSLVVKETTVNTIDQLKGRYRSPKKALFMSLVVPGLGQAYVGHYVRGAAYILADVALGVGWHQYVVVKHDRQVKNYRRYADRHWLQSAYEDGISANITSKEIFEDANPHRSTYCDALHERNTAGGKTLYNACEDPQSAAYSDFFKPYHDDRSWSADSISTHRGDFNNVHNFYEVIGKEDEFIMGWDEAKNVVFTDSSVTGTSAFRDEYISKRAKATDYSRMQVYFLGGMVLNHLVSALDAAISAHYHNKALYQTDVRWYDRLHLDSYLAWEDNYPKPVLTASLKF